jgi:signal transduction histidine kinase
VAANVADVARAVAERCPTATFSASTADTAAARVGVSSGQLEQMLRNLVRNAEVHGEPPVDIEVTMVRDDEGTLVVLTVHDWGDTLHPDFLSAAFGRFQRSDDARSRPGSGLGLALVAALVRRNDGELRLCRGTNHHSNSHRFDFPCAHPPDGTTATIAFSACETTTTLL